MQLKKNIRVTSQPRMQLMHYSERLENNDHYQALYIILCYGTSFLSINNSISTPVHTTQVNSAFNTF